MLRKVRTIGEVAGKRLTKLACCFRMHLLVRQVDDNLNGLVDREFSRPTNDVLLCFFVEIAFSERERV
jgi:hypothetical protein